LLVVFHFPDNLYILTCLLDRDESVPVFSGFPVFPDLKVFRNGEWVELVVWRKFLLQKHIFSPVKSWIVLKIYKILFFLQGLGCLQCPWQWCLTLLCNFLPYSVAWLEDILQVKQLEQNVIHTLLLRDLSPFTLTVTSQLYIP